MLAYLRKQSLGYLASLLQMTPQELQGVVTVILMPVGLPLRCVTPLSVTGLQRAPANGQWATGLPVMLARPACTAFVLPAFSTRLTGLQLQTCVV